MDRRTFLKGLFAATVVPSSVVKALYQPNAGMSEKDLCYIITETLNELPRRRLQKLFEEYAETVEEFRKAVFQPPKGD